MKGIKGNDYYLKLYLEVNRQPLQLFSYGSSWLFLILDNLDNFLVNQNSVRSTVVYLNTAKSLLAIHISDNMFITYMQRGFFFFWLGQQWNVWIFCNLEIDLLVYPEMHYELDSHMNSFK